MKIKDTLLLEQAYEETTWNMMLKRMIAEGKNYEEIENFFLTEAPAWWNRAKSAAAGLVKRAVSTAKQAGQGADMSKITGQMGTPVKQAAAASNTAASTERRHRMAAEKFMKTDKTTPAQPVDLPRLVRELAERYDRLSEHRDKGSDFQKGMKYAFHDAARDLRELMELPNDCSTGNV